MFFRLLFRPSSMQCIAVQKTNNKMHTWQRIGELAEGWSQQPISYVLLRRLMGAPRFRMPNIGVKNMNMCNNWGEL